MKKFVKENFADIVLRVAWHYKNNVAVKEPQVLAAMDRALETMDKYSAYILNVGYMIHIEDIPYVKEYILQLKNMESEFSTEVLDKTYDYLTGLEGDNW